MSQSTETQPLTEAEELFQAWKCHPVTKELFKHLRKRRQELQDSWTKRNFVGNTEYEGVVTNSVAIGLCEAFEDVLNLTVDDLKEDDDGK